jgi:ACT domain-containing protein
MSVNTDQKIIKNKVGLLNLADMLGSVSEACKVMGYSRDSFYRFKGAVRQGRGHQFNPGQRLHLSACYHLCGCIT